MNDDPRFPSNVDQQHITWTQYAEFYNGSNSDPTPPSDNRDTASCPEPISQEELRRRAKVAAEMAIQDQVEQARRNIIHHLRVEECQTWDQSFAMMIRVEQNIIQMMRDQNVGPHERATVAHMLADPLQDVNDWASRQGNAWCVKLNKAVAKKQKTGKRSAPRSTAAPLKPEALMAIRIVSLITLVFLGLIGWWAYRHFF